MNNRTLFRKWSVFLACFAFCGQQAFAAGGSASPLEITVLVVVILLALLFVLAAFYLRKMYAGFSSQSQKAVKEKRFDLLPDYMQKPAAEAYEVLVQSGDSQLADCIIDAGCMSAQTLLAEKSKNTVIKDLITVSVFYKNIKAALRAAKTGRSAQFIESTLTETGVVSKKAMVTAALGGEEKVLELLGKAVTVGGAEAAEAYKKSPGDFEKYADNRLLSTAKRCKYITIGIEPLIGYMLARKAQITDLQIIYSGVKTGQSSDKTLERLRELYG